MMVLSIVLISLEMFLVVLTKCLSSGNAMSREYAWFVVISFFVITALSVVALVANIMGIKSPSRRGKSIAGTAIAGSALFFAVIFDISFLAKMIEYAVA